MKIIPLSILALLTVFFPGLAQQTRPLLIAQQYLLSSDDAASEVVRSPFRYSPAGTDYLTRLRKEYALDAVVANETTDLGRLQVLCRWVHTHLQHDGYQPSTSQDVFEILHAAAEGQPVQCVEYGLVLAAALNAVGLPARPLYLKSADAPTSVTASGHALTEVWLPDRGKWVMADPQWDAVPVLNGRPLNAVEVQQALAENATGLSILSLSRTRAAQYYWWLDPYLYYFDTVLDNRYGPTPNRAGLMLVPLGVENPTVFQRTERLVNMQYTNSLADFYARPQ